MGRIIAAQSFRKGWQGIAQDRFPKQESTGNENARHRAGRIIQTLLCAQQPCAAEGTTAGFAVCPLGGTDGVWRLPTSIRRSAASRTACHSFSCWMKISRGTRLIVIRISLACRLRNWFSANGLSDVGIVALDIRPTPGEVAA